MSQDEFPKEAETAAWIIGKWDTLAPPQQSLCAAMLAIWIDQIRLAGTTFFQSIDAASNAAKSQEAVNKFSENLTLAATNSKLDLLAIFGEHLSNDDLPRRQKFFEIAQLANSNKSPKH